MLCPWIELYVISLLLPNSKHAGNPQERDRCFLNEMQTVQQVRGFDQWREGFAV